MQRWWNELTLRALRRRRLVITVAVVAVLVSVLAFLNRDLDPEPTATTSPAAWRLRPMAGGPAITFEFDQASGWTRLTDSRSPGKELYFYQGRVMLPVDLSALIGREASFLSVPVPAMFPPGMSFEPLDLAPSLDRRPKECTLPSEAEDRYVRFFLASEIPELSSRYGICGRSVFANMSGDALVYSEDLEIETLRHPSAAAVVEVEELGELGQLLLAQLVEEFGARG